MRLTEVTKEIRVQIEEKDLGAFQDLLFNFEALIHESMEIFRARVAREKAHFAKIEELKEEGATPEAIAKLKLTKYANLADLKPLAAAMHQLMAQKREFWDRLEIVRSTEIEVGGGAEGLRDTAPPPPPDFDRFEPHEISADVESIEAGRDPVLPSWAEVGPIDESETKPTPSAVVLQGKGAKHIPDKNGPCSITTTDLVVFPPGGDDEPED